MKALKWTFGMVIAVLMSACTSHDDLVLPSLADQVVGVYQGTLTSGSSQTGLSATTDIIKINEHEIRAHCYCAELDTTFYLELYPDGDLMRVCFTENDFSNWYGHGMSEGTHQMMRNKGDWPSWQQHMTMDHSPGEQHYGYFNKKEGTFTYTFDCTGTSGGYIWNFNGKR